MKTFENIASLKLATLKEGQFVETGGYYSKGDGGGAKYLIKSAADFGGTPDGYGDHTLANGNVAVIQGAEFTVKQYGAVGDNVADDTASIQAAIDANSVVEIPDGQYKVTAELLTTQAVIIHGTGTLRPVAIRTLHLAHAGSEVRGITIQHDVADTTTTATSLLINAVDNCVVDGVTINDSFKTTECVKIKDGNWNVVRNCELNDSRGAGVLIEGTLLGKASNNQVVNNLINGTGYHGVYTRKNASTTNTNNIIANNTIKDVGLNTSVSLCVGIEVWGYGDVVEGNTITGVLDTNKPKAQSYIGITVGVNPYAVVTGNHVSMFVEYGIEVGNVSNNSIVNGNSIRNIYDDLTTPTKGAGLAYTGTSDSKDCQFVNNNISRSFKGYTSPFGQQVSIVGNTFISDLFDRASHSTRGLEILGASTFSLISGNIIQGYDVGVLPAESVLSNDALMISGNILRDCNWGIRTILKPVNITGNHFFNCGSGTNSAAIGLESGSRWVVNGNSFEHEVASSPAIVVKNESTDHGGTVSANKLMTNTVLTGTVTSWVLLNVKDDQLLNGPRVTYGAAVPGSGTFVQGDIIYNNAPAAGGTIGWVCTTGGTPGTWKTFGTIDA